MSDKPEKKEIVIDETLYRQFQSWFVSLIRWNPYKAKELAEIEIKRIEGERKNKPQVVCDSW